MPTLYVLQGPDKGRTYQAPEEAIVIGRSSEQIPLTDHGASRRHAELRPVNGSWVLTDLNSSNGTYLNGRRIVHAVEVHHGDQIRVGSTLLVFHGQNQADRAYGEQMIRDLVDLDLGSEGVESSILSAVDASEESVILQPPETADAVAAWNVVYKVAEIIGSVESVDLFLERVCDILFDHLIADRLVLLRIDSEGKEPRPQVVRYRRKERDGKPVIVTSRTILNHVLRTRDGVLCANAMTDARFTRENMQDSIHRLGLRSILCVPIVSRDRVHGVFHLDCSMSRHTYTQEQLRLVVAIGRLAGLAIDNAELVESRMRTERLAATGETVAYLSHHIRNILQGMQSGADVVELALKKNNLEAAASGWLLVRRNLDRIYHLALNMLTFSKDRQPRIEPVQLNRVVEDVLSLCQGRADEKAVMLLSELDDIPAAPLDAEGMHQVIHNIVLNAIDAAPRETGRVNARTGCNVDQGWVEVSISDNGPGIEAEDREKIFHVFHSSKGQKGTGLGLAAASKIVSELHGRISVDGKPGEGTTFRVRLPFHQADVPDSDKTHGPGR